MTRLPADLATMLRRLKVMKHEPHILLHPALRRVNQISRARGIRENMLTTILVGYRYRI